MEGWVVVLHEGMESHNTGWVSLQVSNATGNCLSDQKKIASVYTINLFSVLGIICAPWHSSIGKYWCLCSKKRGKLYKALSLTVRFIAHDEQEDGDRLIVCLSSLAEVLSQHWQICFLDQWTHMWWYGLWTDGRFSQRWGGRKEECFKLPLS